jgi:hypothetical protein
VLIYVALAFPFAVLIALLLGMPNVKYEFDHGNGTKPGTFFPLLILYQVFFYFIAVDSLLCAKSNHLFVITAIEALLFNGLTVFFYESYLHNRYKSISLQGESNYSLLRYAIVLSLGFSAVVTFVTALVESVWK